MVVVRVQLGAVEPGGTSWDGLDPKSVSGLLDTRPRSAPVPWPGRQAGRSPWRG